MILPAFFHGQALIPSCTNQVQEPLDLVISCKVFVQGQDTVNKYDQKVLICDQYTSNDTRWLGNDLPQELGNLTKNLFRKD